MNKWRLAVFFLLLAALALAPGPGLLAQTVEHLTLKRVVMLAVQNSHELALARLQASVTSGEARLDRAQFRPNLFTGSGATYSYGFPQTPSGAAPTIFSLSYVQTIFNPPLRGQALAAEDRARGQQMAVERTRNEVIVRAASDYLELAKVRGSLDWLRKERESAQKVLDVTRQRVTEGLQLPIENTKAELTRAKIEQRLTELEGREDILEQDLRIVAGLPADARLELSAEEVPAGPDQSLNELIQLAFENSPDLKQAEQERQARQHILNGARGGYWPSIDLVGQYSLFSKINNYDEFFRSFQRNNVNVGLQVQVPIFSARTSAAVALAKAQLRVAEADSGNHRHSLEIEVRKSAREVRVREAAREVARLELKLAQENLSMAQARFDQNRATIADLEQTRVEESEKWLGFLQADFERQRAQLELLKTTGQLAQLFQ